MRSFRQLPRSRQKKLIAVLAAAAVGVGLLPSAFAADGPTLKLAVFDGDVIVAVAKGFDANSTVDFVAKVDGGSGKSEVKANAGGQAIIGFEAPDGFTGDVTVTATSGDDTVSGKKTIGEGSEPAPTTTTKKPSASTTTVKPAATTTTSKPATTTTTAPATGTAPTGPVVGSDGGKIKVMAIGDSITQGAQLGAWRKPLQEKLQAAGMENSLDWVGPFKDLDTTGTIDGDFAAVSGKTNDYLATQATAWVSTYKPNVVIVHAGTNDILYGNGADKAISRMHDLLDAIYAGRPDTTVVLSGIINIYNPDKNNTTGLAEYQAALPKIATEYAGKGKSIQYVNIAPALTQADYQGDGIHMLASGNDKMAGAYFAGLNSLFSAK